MINPASGTPVECYAQLTNAAHGATNFSIFDVMGGAAISAIAANERLYIVSIIFSSNDATAALVTMDTGGTTPTKLVSAYISATQQLQPETIPPGICRGIFGVSPRVQATAVSVSATVECVIQGYLSKT